MWSQTISIYIYIFTIFYRFLPILPVNLFFFTILPVNLKPGKSSTLVEGGRASNDHFVEKRKITSIKNLNFFSDSNWLCIDQT